MATARLTGTILTDDDTFRAELTELLRAGTVRVSIIDERLARGTSAPDVAIVDGRRDAAEAMRAIERLRAANAGAAIFMVAAEASPDLILQSMRAGANEFFAWPPQASAFHEALSRTAARVQSTSSTRAQAYVLMFLGAKGGVGTTTLAVNTAVDLARLSGRSTVIVDLKPGIGEVGLFLGVRSRYTLLDALDNLQRLDTEFLRELVGKHKSGVDILGGSDQFDRPGPSDGPGVEEVIRMLSSQYDFVIIDAGTQLTAANTAPLYAADTICLVANPDVASVRNTQRVLERIRQLGPSADRIRLLLNRAAEPYPIPPAQIEAALGHPIHQRFPSDYRTVAMALNSGVPLTLAGNSDLATQFERLTRAFLPGATEPEAAPARRPASMLGFDRLASLW
ncbi:MAG TPA: AAA family ATPase [Vicinamibacterales bacterium]|jgi:pilus assembly protein CpaE|nr:AAA family ATPase [Vicinamibacterales bacterium]